MPAAAATPPGDWDPSQKAVIFSGANRRLIVDAGPGTGKTAVACARLGHLVLAEDVRPSQTWMISFTRTAIAEIRARLHSYIGDAAFAVKVATVDAHAWAIHSGYDPVASLTGSCEENIERVLSLVEGDDDVIDYLGNVEHLIVDEAQDLVGLRADLVEAIIARLDPSCGVWSLRPDAGWTVFTPWLRRIEVHSGALVVTIVPPGHERWLKRIEAPSEAQLLASGQLRITVPATIVVRGGRSRIAGSGLVRTRPDPLLISGLGRAHAVLASRGIDLLDRQCDFASAAGIENPYNRSLVPLAFLAPEIEQAILAGRQPEGMG